MALGNLGSNLYNAIQKIIKAPIAHKLDTNLKHYFAGHLAKYDGVLFDSSKVVLFASGLEPVTLVHTRNSHS